MRRSPRSVEGYCGGEGGGGGEIRPLNSHNGPLLYIYIYNGGFAPLSIKDPHNGGFEPRGI